MTTLTRRALSLFPRCADNIHSAPLTLRLIASYAAQNPGLEYGNYSSGWNDRAGRAAYFAESRQITKDLHRVRDAMRDAWYSGVTDDDVVQASQSAFSGRLTIKPREAGGFSIDYCTGQYWPTEYRKACAAVLEYAARIAQRRSEGQKAA